MGFWYDRIETEQEIKIVYKKYALYYWGLMVSLGLAFFFGSSQGWDNPLTNLIYGIAIFFVFGGLIFFGKAHKELKAAMKKGGVNISGSKLSFSSPLTCIIKK